MAAVESSSGTETETDSEYQEPNIKFISDEFPKVILRRSARQITREEEQEEEKISNEAEADKIKEQKLLKTRVLQASGSDLGQAIFGFKTPKRKEALVNAAQNSIQSGKKSTSKPRTKSRTNVSKEKAPGRKPLKTLNKKTPFFVQENGGSDLSDESEDSEESQSEDEENEDSKQTASKELTASDILDEYFEIHSAKNRTTTSDKTLSRLTNPKLQQKDIISHLKEVQSTHIHETAKLIQMHSCYFQNWMFQMLNGFNVLLYGFGSKHKLLEEFRKRHLKDQCHIVINGFFPSITIKQILNMITEDLMNSQLSIRNTIDQANHIKKFYDVDKHGKLFLLIHNIDGQMLRSKNVQSILSCLASAKNIHIISSIDHINAPLIWDQNISSQFNWLWHDCTTYDAYNEETSYENSLMVQQSGSLALSSLIHVLRSLTPNAKGIFRLLVDIQLDNEDNSSYQGLSFTDLYNRCRERFLVNSDLTLRAQLTEFKDHKLVKSKKGFNGLEYLSVALDCGTLRQYLEHESSNT
ncbi:origin recognition complex subunit 2-like [Clytia hemisphaerica]